MKMFLLSLSLVFGASRLVAHVGSPNVFFQGAAGGYATFAVIRPPATLPGPAQISVRINDPDVRSVAVVPVLWPAERSGAATPVTAQRVAGETNLWSAQVWLLRPGSYTFQIKLDGARGPGEAHVPVNALGQVSQPMSTRLRLALAFGGLALFAGAIVIVRAIARDGLVEPTAARVPGNFTREKWAVAAAFLLLTAGVVAGAARWREMDARYRSQSLQRPEPVNTALRSETNRLVLELQSADASSPTSPSWAALVPDHGKLMHLFLVRRTTLDAFAHLHPLRVAPRRFDLELPRLPPGEYELYGEITLENGLNQTLVARVQLPEPSGNAPELPALTTNGADNVFCGFPPGAGTNGVLSGRDPEDSWHLSRAGDQPLPAPRGLGAAARLMGGYSLVWENPGPVSRGADSVLRFAAFAPDGSEVTLQPYMGMRGHAAVRKTDGSVFAHLHPTGSFSMASQEAFRPRAPDPASGLPGIPPQVSAGPSHRVEFPYEFPQRGDYRLWVQVRIAGRVLTGVYDLAVSSKP